MNSRVYSTVKPTPEPEPFKPVKPLDALPLGLALQPGLLRRMGKHPEAREQGFSARFLYSIPDSKAGSRLYQNRRIDPAAANIYRNTLQRLLQIPAVTMVDEPPEFPELALTGEGREVWRDYHDATEKAMRPGGPLAGCRDFAGKLAGHAARLAGILAMVKGGADAIGRTIPADAVQAAVAMMQGYFQLHGLAAYSMMFETGEGSLACRVYGWIQRHRDDLEGLLEFSQADLYQALRGGADVNDPNDLTEPLAVMVERGFIRQLPPEPATGPGRPKGARFQVNPSFYV